MFSKKKKLVEDVEEIDSEDELKKCPALKVTPKLSSLTVSLFHVMHKLFCAFR